MRTFGKENNENGHSAGAGERRAAISSIHIYITFYTYRVDRPLFYAYGLDGAAMDGSPFLLLFQAMRDLELI